MGSGVSCTAPLQTVRATSCACSTTRSRQSPCDQATYSCSQRMSVMLFAGRRHQPVMPTPRRNPTQTPRHRPRRHHSRRSLHLWHPPSRCHRHHRRRGLTGCTAWCASTARLHSKRSCSDMRRPPCSAQRVTHASLSFPPTRGRGVLLRIDRGRAYWLGFVFGDGWARRRGQFNGGLRSSLGCASGGDWGHGRARLGRGNTSLRSSSLPLASLREWLWVSDGTVWQDGCACLRGLDCCRRGLSCDCDGWASWRDFLCGAGCVRGRLW
jgi:hypothetical protein